MFGKGIQKKYRLYIDPDDDAIYQKSKHGVKKVTNIINDETTITLLNSVIIEKEENQEFLDILNQIVESVPKEIRAQFENLINK